MILQLNLQPYFMNNYSLILLIAIFTFIAASCDSEEKTAIQGTAIVDSTELLGDLQYLSSDELEGRRTGEQGNRMAQDYIEDRFQSLNLQMAGESYRHLFNFTNSRTEENFTDAVNLIGYVQGSSNPDQYIVVTAHYDHLGISDGEIYNGADDNASGTGGLLAAARYFSENIPQNSLLFIAFDAEEQGLSGARLFIENPAVPLDQIAVNVNMDMISTNFENEIYAVGTAHYPFLKPFIDESITDTTITVSFGYDTDEWPQNWTLSSDHGPFHLEGIPFVYFGVEDHPHYHQPTDTFDSINPDFYLKAVETIIGVIENLDENLDQIVELSN
tara:strand:- start:11308 stop:12297 length:990 start_codon:yes stop_codon:yes gene_type:complete